MKKSVLMVLFLVLGMAVLTGCGSKLDKTGEEFKNKIIDYNNENLKDEKKFSFLIYKDKDTNRYLADVWVPTENKSSSVEYFYYYGEDKRLEESESRASFDDVKANGNYEVVYKAGKFE
ncbi:hypothetical protein [Enterococcus faecalis]|uniref:hypothetical protein n=1 Tax=Enterococcus faecalis TaxID=1351 RepID=UPI000CF1E429|nr:hypothetical protein [Enterococcus faecalis]EGO2667724.1 hypothetical protein [Enterococcus faecalis]EGO2693937.1 hypothetical protein [Enterococcus faecalis]EGO6066937.1 hypothetical protein [Enterococcus faecalis]EHS7922757.1 hypothetical protein [Enterococcus faecalis]EIA6630417.1 hypothetical protein [Enterococcus faecalis]